MHPNPLFRDGDTDWLEFADGIGFAQVFAATPDGPMVVQAPVSRFGNALRFHVARGNRITRFLDGAAVLVSVVGPDGYVSPNWYAAPASQVPTWNYIGAEFDGTAYRLEDAGLIEQLDALARRHEPRFNPWTRDKMDDALLRKMLLGILGFEVAVSAVRGTRKLSQNKSATDRARVADGLEAEGNAAMAQAMRG